MLKFNSEKKMHCASLWIETLFKFQIKWKISFSANNWGHSGVKTFLEVHNNENCYNNINKYIMILMFILKYQKVHSTCWFGIYYYYTFQSKQFSCILNIIRLLISIFLLWLSLMTFFIAYGNDTQNSSGDIHNTRICKTMHEYGMFMTNYLLRKIM